MQVKKRSSLLVLLSCSVLYGFTLGSVAAASDVITVRANGTADIIDLPAAINAAKDGDVLLVENGN